MADENFYRDISAFAQFSGVCDDEHYSQVPSSWDLVITDVVGSTKAIEEGRYKDVNAAGVSSIVVVRNAMEGLDIPYIFGGDGATLLTPSSKRSDLEAALRGLREACREAFSLEMRVGIVPVSRLIDSGHDMAVARYAASKDVSFAMFRGSGLDQAEAWVKDAKQGQEFDVSEEGPVFDSFEGFRCRWRPVPSRHGLATSVIVKARGKSQEERNQTYRMVLEKIAPILQLTEEGCPVSTSTLKMQSSPGGFQQELSLLSVGKSDAFRKKLAKKIFKETRIGRFLLRMKLRAGSFDGKGYLQEMVANTDYRKFDNVLRMHLDLRRGQLESIKELLQAAEDSGHLYYGIHTASESLITCVIDSYRGSHAHFVDGGAGGYALASKRIKAMTKRVR